MRFLFRNFLTPLRKAIAESWHASAKELTDELRILGIHRDLEDEDPPPGVGV
jgi:hypothetical protein